MEELVTLILNNGFAIGIASYTIVVVNKSIQANTIAITKLSEQMNKTKEV